MIFSKEFVQVSIQSLKKRKLRSFLTILSIFFGIMTIFIFISFGIGLHNYVNGFLSESSADKIIIMSRGGGGVDFSFSLSENDLRAIERISGVYEVEGNKFGVAEISQAGSRKYVFAIGYDPDKSLMLEYGNMNIERGRDLRRGDSGRVVLGHSYLFENRVLPRALDLNERIRINERDFVVIGFFDSLGNPQDDAQIYFPNEYFSGIFPDVKGYSLAVARVDISNIEVVSENIERALRNSRNLEQGKEDFSVTSFENLIESYTDVLNIIIGFVILIALISVFVSTINTANTMVTSIIERTKEIGIMKSIGAKNSNIFGLFLFESGILGFVAGVLGVLVGWILTSIISVILVEAGYGFLQPGYSFSLFLGCILFATFTGALSGVFPAMNAAKTNPVKALRYE